VYHGDEAVFLKNIKHSVDDAASAGSFDSEVGKRKALIQKELSDLDGFDFAKVDAFVGRGGGLKPAPSGTYEINDVMIKDIREDKVLHASMFAPQIAYDFAKQHNKKAYIVNAITADELIDEARVTGIREITRASHIHTLNQKEVAHRAAVELGGKYQDKNFIVIHLGGGISVTAHRKGKMIDSTDAIVGEGPMSPTRCGAMSVMSVVDLCFSGKYTKEEMHELIMTKSGLTSHLGVSDGLTIENMIKAGDKHVQFIYGAMIYQLAKYTGMMAAVLEGAVDAILVTGGLARDKYLVEALTAKTKFIAPLHVYPGEFEMEALTHGALRVLRGEESALTYTGIPSFQGFEWDKTGSR
jgi:butyrate kinase